MVKKLWLVCRKKKDRYASSTGSMVSECFSFGEKKFFFFLFFLNLIMLWKSILEIEFNSMPRISLSLGNRTGQCVVEYLLSLMFICANVKWSAVSDDFWFSYRGFSLMIIFERATSIFAVKNASYMFV